MIPIRTSTDMRTWKASGFVFDSLPEWAMREVPKARNAWARSREITGPYIDQAGKPMTDGGGSLVIEATTPAWRGPGHPGFLREDGYDYMLFHAYFGEGRGQGSALQISTVAWQEDGWPRVGTLP